MQSSEARRSERVHYRAPVELRASEVDDADAVLGEAIDLGPGGMRISARARVPVGAHVTCRVELDGCAASLPGRVAWLAHGESGNGIGICFDPLGSHESALLQQTMERSRGAYRSVELRFADIEPPIRARARATTSGLRLSALLPIIARGTELSFRLDEEGPQFRGRVSEAALHEEHGARKLEVDVEVIDGDSVRFRRRARYGYPLEIEAEEVRAATPPPAQVTQNGTRAGGYATRIAALLLAASSGALVGWGAARSSSVAASIPRPAQTTRRSVAPAQPAASFARAAALEPTAARAAAPGIDVRVEGDVTRVLLPFAGSLEQMQARQWASPFALAIDLPNGRTDLAVGVHPLQLGSAEDVRIQRPFAGGELIRVKLATPLARYAVTAQNGTLELRLVRHPAIAPSP